MHLSSYQLPTASTTCGFGSDVRDDTAGIDTFTAALALVDGQLHPARDRTDIVHALRHAQRVHQDLEAGIA
ncbi:hypothetical protein ACF9IK_00070 [Kitasatospora hibisci]|uniref:hypothetical protein n=1 Tax=Kitasatospora hibisci TaxID=3369522 RepID=UPI003754AE18